MPVSHKEEHGYELLQGASVFEGELLGGCIDSMGEMLMSGDMSALGDEIAPLLEMCPALEDDFREQREIIERYGIFPEKQEWKGKILFAETSEVMPAPEKLREYLEALKSAGVFDGISGIIVGKPMNEKYYEEYKQVWIDAVADPQLPILYNVNFGHASPRAILPYGAMAHVDADRQEIVLGNAD